MERNENKPSFGQRWDQVRAPKKAVFWIAVAAVVVTLIVGFSLGGWVTSGTARAMADEAVVQRLATVCVAQFDLNPAKDQNLAELKATSSWQRRTYIETAGWATMPGEEKPDSKVAAACAALLTQPSQETISQTK